VASSASAKKRIKQNVRNRLRNRARKSVLKTETRKFLDALDKGEVQLAQEMFARVQKRLDDDPAKVPLRSKTVEHPFGTIKAWMGATHFKMKTLEHVATEMALHVLAYNMTRVIAILGVRRLTKAMRA